MKADKQGRTDHAATIDLVIVLHIVRDAQTPASLTFDLTDPQSESE